jgi:tetratricopeptide (TPR) repeat protein
VQKGLRTYGLPLRPIVLLAADALAVFHQLRGQLDAELGIYPGPDLGRLYEAILRADPSLGSAVSGGAAGSLAAAPSVSSALAVPRQLPARVAGFTGRSEPLRDLDARAAARDQSVVITAITGAPGVGKSALAVSWAHSVQAQFPDGTFFANLRGYDPAGIPAEPGEVLQGFLRALLVPADAIPAGDDERAALLRTSLDRKRALIILDNAASPQQVRPLLPGSAGCAVVVTSRSRLSGLVARDGATRITLAPLPDVEAVALLRETVGSKRVEAEPDAVDKVVRLCGGLPLALRIAADHAAGSGSLQLAELAGQLTDERNRLQVLTTDDDDTAVRAAFSWSYRGLPAEAARAFRLLGLHPGAECSLPAAAALVGLAVSGTRRVLGTLTGAHLVEEVAADRYRLHDLLAVYAAERARHEEPGPVRDGATRQILSWYLHTAEAADRVLIPRRQRPPLGAPGPGIEPLAFASYEEAFDWCETERVNLAAAIQHAAAAGNDVIAWQLPAALGAYLKLSRRWDDWTATHRTGLAAARRLADRAAEAWLLTSLGGAHGDLRQFAEADECFQRALVLRAEFGDLPGEAATLLNMGFLRWKQHQFGEGIRCFRRTLAIAREIGDAYVEAMALNNLGEAYQELGRHGEALDHLRQALAIFRATGDLYNEAMTLDSLGSAQVGMGHYDEGLDLLRDALALRRQAGDRMGEADTLSRIAGALHDKGEASAARESWRLALVIFDELGAPQADEIRIRLTAAAD